MKSVTRLLLTFSSVLMLCTHANASGANQPQTDPTQCAFPGAREIPAASLFIADSTEFDNYQYVWVNEISFDRSTQHLTHRNRRNLSELIRNSIERQWQERLGWRSAEAPAGNVASLNVVVRAVSPDDKLLQISAVLRDSDSGKQLMSQCNTTLTLLPQPAGPDIRMASLQQQVNHWGAGLGSHIMTVY